MAYQVLVLRWPEVLDSKNARVRLSEREPLQEAPVLANNPAAGLHAGQHPQLLSTQLAMLEAGQIANGLAKYLRRGNAQLPRNE